MRRKRFHGDYLDLIAESKIWLDDSSSCVEKRLFHRIFYRSLPPGVVRQLTIK